MLTVDCNGIGVAPANVAPRAYREHNSHGRLRSHL